MSKKDEAQTTALSEAKQQQLAIYSQMAGDSGEGFEEASMDSFAIPFLSILQSGSPQCKRSDGAYLEGAEEGKIFNSVTQRIIDGESGVMLVPFYFAQRFIVWGLREKGGGFKGEYMPNDPIISQTTRDDNGRDILNSNKDCQLVDTRVHYCLQIDANGANPVVVSFTSTQVKKSKQWMSRMKGIRIPNADGVLVEAPMASHIWTVTTVPEQNDKGSWFGFKIGSAELLTDMSVYAKAKELRSQVVSGLAKAQYVEEDSEKF